MENVSLRYFIRQKSRRLRLNSQARRRSISMPLLSCLFLLCAVGAASLFVSTRQEIQPERTTFVAFPNPIGEWRGRPAVLGSDVERGLGLTDYILSDYVQRDGRQVNLYIAYYASQRSGLSPHSPSVCIPGNGWQITQFERTHYTDNNRGISIPINRVIIGKGSSKQLVYYWFEQRGMRNRQRIRIEIISTPRRNFDEPH